MPHIAALVVNLPSAPVLPYLPPQQLPRQRQPLHQVQLSAPMALAEALVISHVRVPPMEYVQPPFLREKNNNWECRTVAPSTVTVAATQRTAAWAVSLISALALRHPPHQPRHRHQHPRRLRSQSAPTVRVEATLVSPVKGPALGYVPSTLAREADTKLIAGLLLPIRLLRQRRRTLRHRVPNRFRHLSRSYYYYFFSCFQPHSMYYEVGHRLRHRLPDSDGKARTLRQLRRIRSALAGILQIAALYKRICGKSASRKGG